jgi:hypothetical protein
MSYGSRTPAVNLVEFEVLTVGLVNRSIFWVIAPCSQSIVKRLLGEHFASIFRAEE